MIKMEEFYPFILEAFEQDKTFQFPIHGTSMQPLLHTNDLVTIQKIDSFNKGDMVLYQRENGQFVLHRIRKVKQDKLTFVGDHQFSVEKGILKSQCIGKVISYKKQGKDKIYPLKGVKYKCYLYLVRFALIRGIFSKVL